jgi:hypothetical protein
METLATTPNAAPGTEKRRSAPSAAANSAEAGPLRAQFILVEDVDHLMRTGESRQVLNVRWVY